MTAPDNTATLVKMFESNLWANQELFTICARLDDQQLAVEAGGVFGRIQPTAAHIVRAEGGYLNRLTGARPWPEDLDWDSLSVAELRPFAEQSGNLLIAAATSADPAVSYDVIDEGQRYRFYNWTVLLQALYHGIEHRTQLKVLLTKLGVPHPDLDVWEYTDHLTGAPLPLDSQ